MTRHNSEYKRVERDDYPTPAWATYAIVPYLRSRGISIVYECAPGPERKMVRALQSAGLDVRYARSPKFDFIKLKALPEGIQAALTNPPFSREEEFIEHALQLTEPRRGLVCMFLNNQDDYAVTRRRLFERPQFAHQIKIMKRVDFFDPPPGEKKVSGKENFAWYVWDWEHAGPATISYYHPKDHGIAA
jgi:hypothetical protein